ncbi:MAG: hypothetical protein FWD73_16590 [Polyangiaceae bacterium]|nr:hypothetical protein [Polyangiaceae bacterium]
MIPTSPPAAPPASLASLETIKRPARTAERRLRLARATKWVGKALVGGLALVAVLVAAVKLHAIGVRAAAIGVAMTAAAALAIAIGAYVRSLPRCAGAAALDKYHGLSDRLSSALSFGELPATARTAFMNVAIEDALEHAPKVDPKKAVPIPLPREWPIVVVMGGVVLALVLLHGHEKLNHTSPVANTIDAVDVTQDDVDALREFLRATDQRFQTDEAKAATQEFNQLIEDLANKRLDRTEAFRRMQQLEDKLLEGREADAKALEEALKKMGEALKKSELTKRAGEALENKNLAVAESAMKDLAKKLREQGGGIDKAQLEKLRAALKNASEGQAKRAEAIASRREELKQQLLKQPSGDGGASEQEKSLLQKRERELDRLDRDSEQTQKTQRELDRLDRELEKAAEDLMKDMGLSAQDLENAAEDINRMGRNEMTQQEKEQLRQKLQDLREMLRQQAQGGQGQMARLRMFQLRARGQSGQPGSSQGQGQQNDKQAGNGQGQGQGKEGQGTQGKGQSQGQGAQGQTAGGGDGEVWVMGPGGDKAMLITAGKSPGSHSASRSAQNGDQGGDQGQGGHKWGDGHDPKVQGSATNFKGATEDTQVAGNDTGQGGSRSEVILGAAERGFASRGYHRVFHEYHTVAEEALDRDEIPGGYRFYVRRYFQLIRPREDSHSPVAPAAPAAPTTP